MLVNQEVLSTAHVVLRWFPFVCFSLECLGLVEAPANRIVSPNGIPGISIPTLQTLNIAIPTSWIMSMYNNCIHCMSSFDQIGQLQESNIHIPQFWSTTDPQFSTIWCMKHQVLISLVFPNMRLLPRETTNKVDWNKWIETGGTIWSNLFSWCP